MTLADVADPTGLSWDTVKGIVKPFLQTTVEDLRCQDLKYLAVDEIYVGRRKSFTRW